MIDKKIMIKRLEDRALKQNDLFKRIVSEYEDTFDIIFNCTDDGNISKFQKMRLYNIAFRYMAKDLKQIKKVLKRIKKDERKADREARRAERKAAKAAKKE